MIYPKLRNSPVTVSNTLNAMRNEIIEINTSNQQILPKVAGISLDTVFFNVFRARKEIKAEAKRGMRALISMKNPPGEFVDIVCIFSLYNTNMFGYGLRYYQCHSIIESVTKC